MTNYTKKFFAGPLKFMREYAIAPPNDVGANRGKTATTLDTSGFKPNVNTLTSQPASVRYARMMSGEKVAYVKFYKDDIQGGRSGTEQEGRGVLRFDASYDPPKKNDFRPIYFLPWDTSGAIIRLTIPPKGRLETDPDIFFTATINGCSVFIQGDPDNPTVYHAGGNTGQSDHNEAGKFWRQALLNHIKSSGTAQQRGLIKAEVNKTDYVKTPGTFKDQTTWRAQEYEDWLKDKLNKSGSAKVTQVSPWGCVMGIRTLNQWEFYLQENATVIVTHVTKKGVRYNYYARPMHIRRIYPGSSAVATMAMTVPMKLQ
jgi:hypothetical protein